MTPTQRAFVQHKLMGLSNRMAVIEAGYSWSGAKQRGTKLMRHGGIRAALLKGGFDLAAADLTARPVFRRSAGRWLALAASMKKRVYDDPAEFLFDAMNCADLPDALRIQFAKTLLPYQHKRIG